MKKYLSPRPQFAVSQRVQFDEANHNYIIDGRLITASASQLNGVAQLYYAALKVGGMERILDKAITRGKIIHGFIELLIRHDFDEKLIQPFLNEHPGEISKTTLATMRKLFPWLKEFMADRQLLMIEQVLISAEIPELVGTFDLLVFNKITENIELIDFKGSDGSKVKDHLFSVLYAPQLMIYEHLIQSNFFVYKNVYKMIIFTGGKDFVIRSI